LSNDSKNNNVDSIAFRKARWFLDLVTVAPAILKSLPVGTEVDGINKYYIASL